MLNYSQCNISTERPIYMPSLKELERWMGTGQVAKKLGYSRQGVINLAEEGKIRAVKTGAGWIYDPDSVEMFKARLKASKGG
jgi:excisionase family DNA binding protein